MMTTEGFTLILAFDPDGTLTRRFDPDSFPDSTPWQQTRELINDKDFIARLAHALAQIHDMNEVEVRGILSVAFQKGQNTFTDPAPMQPYWHHLFRTLRLETAKQYNEYLIGIKACRSHYFYTLHGSNGPNGQSKLLHPPFFEGAAPPPNPLKAADKLRGIPDTVLFFAPQLQEYRDRLFEFLGWFDITLRCAPTANPPDALTLDVQPNRRQPSKCISLGNKPILVVSQNFREAIANLSEVWLNPRARTMLLCGWTGSGKEVLIELLADAMMVGENKVITSAAELAKFEALRNKLISSKTQLLLSLEPSSPSSNRSLLFLDEIHHPSAEPLRVGLLRLLTSGKFEDEATNQVYYCDAVL